MIALDITARNYEVDDKLASYVSDKINALEKYLPRGLKGTATGVAVFTDDANGREDNRYVCEVILKVNGQSLMSKEGTINMYAAVDIVEAKLASQCRSLKDKYTTQPRRAKMLGRLIGRTAESEMTVADPE